MWLEATVHEKVSFTTISPDENVENVIENIEWQYAYDPNKRYISIYDRHDACMMKKNAEWTRWTTIKKKLKKNKQAKKNFEQSYVLDKGTSLILFYLEEHHGNGVLIT